MTEIENLLKNLQDGRDKLRGKIKILEDCLNQAKTQEQKKQLKEEINKARQIDIKIGRITGLLKHGTGHFHFGILENAIKGGKQGIEEFFAKPLHKIEGTLFHLNKKDKTKVVIVGNKLNKTKIHTRQISTETYVVDEDYLLVEGVLKDDRTKVSRRSTGELISAGTIHHMVIRLLLKLPALEIEDLEVEIINSSLNLLPLFLIPAIGGLISGFIVYTFAPETEGHGTDAIIRAFHQIKERVRVT